MHVMELVKLTVLVVCCFSPILAVTYGQLPPFRTGVDGENGTIEAEESGGEMGEGFCKLLCYYTKTTNELPEANLQPSGFPDPMPCTHLVYGYAAINPMHKVEPALQTDLPTLAARGTYHDINRWKTRYPFLSTLVAIKPTEHGFMGKRKPESDVTRPSLDFLSNAYTRSAFALSAKKFVLRHSFDGLILHLENPAEVKNQYLQLVKDLRSAFGHVLNQKLLELGVAIDARNLKIFNETLSQINAQVDFVHVLSYATEASMDELTTCYVNPLFPATGVKREQTILQVTDLAMKLGIARQKLVVGLSLWSSSRKLSDAESADVGSPAIGWGSPGRFTNQPGKLAYYEMCEFRNRSRLRTYIEDKNAVAGTLISEDNDWISGPINRTLFRQKLAWLKEENFGGIGLVSLNDDDFQGLCEESPFPLIKSAAAVMQCADRFLTTTADTQVDTPTSTPARADLTPLIPARITPMQAYTGTGPTRRPTSESEGLMTQPAEVEVPKRIPTVIPPFGPLEKTLCTRMCFYRPRKDLTAFSFENFAVSLCTHIVLAFVIPDDEGSLIIRPHVGLAHREYAQWNPTTGFKPLLMFAVGGPQMESWRTLVRSPTRRTRFIQSIVSLLNVAGADGVDIHWDHGLNTQDEKQGLTELLKEMRSQFDKDLAYRLLMLSVYPHATFNDMYNIPEISKHVDHIHLIGDKFHSSSSAQTGHHSGLFAVTGEIYNPLMTLEGFSSHWLTKGLPRKKMIVGISAEAVTQTLALEFIETEPGLGIPTWGRGRPAKKTRTPGLAAYYEVCEMLSKHPSMYRWLSNLGVPIGTFSDQFVAYDNPDSVELKTLWAASNKLGGVALFGLEYDDPNGECTGNEKFPLLKTINKAQACKN